jgi:anaerobic selenocysteine-containing dehydrogenase
MEEVVTPSGATQASLSLSVPLLQPPPSAMHPMVFLTKLADAAGIAGLPSATYQSLIKQRIEQLYANRSGMIVSASDGSRRKVADLASADTLWRMMQNGDCWLGHGAGTSRPQQFSALECSSETMLQEIGNTCALTPGELILMPTAWRATADSGSISPVMSKIFQESDLRSISGRVFVNPSTAAAHGVTSGGRAIVQTRIGSAIVTIVESETVMPGVISAVVGPLPNGMTAKDELNNGTILALCDLQQNGTWRATPATMGRVDDARRL